MISWNPLKTVAMFWLPLSMLLTPPILLLEVMSGIKATQLNCFIYWAGLCWECGFFYLSGSRFSEFAFCAYFSTSTSGGAIRLALPLCCMFEPPNPGEASDHFLIHVSPPVKPKTTAQTELPFWMVDACCLEATGWPTESTYQFASFWGYLYALSKTGVSPRAADPCTPFPLAQKSNPDAW